MEIWLIRHGKAEVSAPGIPDEKRRLVTKGKEQAMGLARHLEKALLGRKVQFWTSPLVRAFETTEVLMASFKGIPHIQSEISEGDLIGLLPLWEKNGAEVQVVVGHEPFLSEWLYEMTGERQDFSTGSAVVIDLSQVIPPKGRRIVYVDEKELN